MATQSSIDKVWLPIHKRGRQIVSVGDHQLPESIFIPAGLTPMSSALAFVHKAPPHTLRGLQLFFPPEEENTVFQWAHAYPIVVSHTGGAYWHRQRGGYLTPDKTSPGGYKWLNQQPAQVSKVWHINGSFSTKSRYYAITWSAGDYQVDGAGTHPMSASDIMHANLEEFGDGSPMKGVPRRLSLFLDFVGQRPLKVWIPIHEQNHRIVALGAYRLPDPISVPTDLDPISPALATFVQPSHTIAGLDLYFRPEQENAVFKWAQTYPSVFSDPGGTQWHDKFGLYQTAQQANAGDYLLPCPPGSPDQIAWHTSGTLFTKHGRYVMGWNGMTTITAEDLKTNPVAQRLLGNWAADYVGDADDFGRNSPLEGEHRHVSMHISFPRAPGADISPSTSLKH